MEFNMYKAVYDLGGIYLVSFNKKFMDVANASHLKSNYYNWWMNQEVTEHNSHGLLQESQADFDRLFKSIENKEILSLAIIEKPTAERKTDLHIGNVSLQRFDWINRSAELAIVLGEQESWGKGYATRACKCIIEHGFEKMNMNRIWTGTAATNTGMRTVAGKLCMSREGKFREAVFLNGRYVDVYEYAILASEYYQGKNEL
jgi:RimJ/RimL family protein N-acetyltransferase